MIERQKERESSSINPNKTISKIFNDDDDDDDDE